MGYAPGTDTAASLRILRHLLGEAEQHTTALRAHLPATFPFTTNQQTLEDLEAIGVE
jgi:hypothetical protein